MFRSLLLVVFNFIFLFSLSGQSYVAAESAEYDPINDRWYVSNGNSIIIDDGSNNLSFFGDGKSNAGMEMCNGYIFCVDGTAIVGYDVNTELEVCRVDFPDSGYLNGLTNNGDGILYATDFLKRTIYEINVKDIESPIGSLLVEGLPSTPNGIVYDKINDRLIYVSFSNDAIIYSVDIETKHIGAIANPPYGSLDGIDEDNEGNYYISSYSDNVIFRYDRFFNQIPEVLATPILNNPADLGYSLETDTYAIPMGDRVLFISRTLSTEEGIDTKNTLDIYPNPIKSHASIHFNIQEKTNIALEIQNQIGQTVKTLYKGILLAGNHKMNLSNANLSNGIYYVSLKSEKQSLTKKFIVSK